MKLLKFAIALGGIVPNGSDGDFIDINISDVDIYEHGQQRGYIENLVLKTDGIGEDIVAIETALLKNFTYSTRHRRNPGHWACFW
jgi:hypothetical protein